MIRSRFLRVSSSSSARRACRDSSSSGEAPGVDCSRSCASSASAEELEALHARLAELEDETRKNRDRVTRLYARLKAEERAREKALKAVTVASQLLAETPAPTAESTGPSLEPVPGEAEPGTDEPAVA